MLVAVLQVQKEKITEALVMPQLQGYATATQKMAAVCHYLKSC